VGARAGKLTFMIGGDAATLDLCRPVFDHMAGNIFLLGQLGAGQAGKLANNLLYNAGVVAAVESMRLAVAAGISEEEAAQLFSVSTGTNFTIANWARLMGKRAEPEAAQRIAALRHKDVALALAMAEELGEEVALGERVLDRIDWAIAHARPGADGR
jgi:3-hydroxyisobutyrate dehydrogenase-like beta-hydroxyacid dehydrogenase